MGGGRPASAYALALAHLDCVKSLNIKQKRNRRIVRAMKSPTIAGTVVSAKGPNASRKEKKLHSVLSPKISLFNNWGHSRAWVRNL